MARWVKRLDACKIAAVGRTKLDQLIAAGLVRAKKDPSGRNTTVYVDLDSVDAYYEGLPDARDARAEIRQQRRSAA